MDNSPNILSPLTHSLAHPHSPNIIATGLSTLVTTPSPVSESSSQLFNSYFLSWQLTSQNSPLHFFHPRNISYPLTVLFFSLCLNRFHIPPYPVQVLWSIIITLQMCLTFLTSVVSPPVLQTPFFLNFSKVFKLGD